MSEGLVSCQSQFILPEVIEDWPEKIHSCVFPEPSESEESLVPEDVRHGGKLVVGTAFVELLDIFEDFKGKREVVFGDVLKFPQLEFIGGVNYSSLFEEVGFDGRQFSSEPGLVDDLGDQRFSLLLVEGHKFVSLVENDHFLEGDFEVN